VIGNIRGKRIEFEGSRFVSTKYYESLDPIRRPVTGDLLYTLVGSYGIPVVVKDGRPFCVQRHVGVIRPSKAVNVNYLAYAMESRFVLAQATAGATGIAQKTVPLSVLRKILIPLPPLAEQRRIVAKVDELMAVCDQLEAQLEAVSADHSALLEATLREVLTSGARVPAMTTEIS
jgi:type I restriction enzyme S subunit